MFGSIVVCHFHIDVRKEAWVHWRTHRAYNNTEHRLGIIHAVPPGGAHTFYRPQSTTQWERSVFVFNTYITRIASWKFLEKGKTAK